MTADTITRTVPLALPREFLEGIMVTAYEGGVGYWFRGWAHEQTETGYAWIAGYDHEDAFGETDLPPFQGYRDLDKAVRKALIDGDNDKIAETFTLIDADTIADGIERLLSGQVGVNRAILSAIQADVQEATSPDPQVRKYAGGNIDADAADAIVQAGIWGELVYG
jgi:hypothetical protein